MKLEFLGTGRYRHTFKQWIINGGNVVSISKLLGYSSLEITQNYINLRKDDIQNCAALFARSQIFVHMRDVIKTAHLGNLRFVVFSFMDKLLSLFDAFF